MSASPTRRNKRFQERESKKLFLKIQRETMEQINKHTPEERQQLLELYDVMLKQREQERINRENTVIVEGEEQEQNTLQWDVDVKNENQLL
jgi:hypothetical protein